MNAGRKMTASIIGIGKMFELPVHISTILANRTITATLADVTIARVATFLAS